MAWERVMAASVSNDDRSGLPDTGGSRWLGLERSSILPALVSLALMAIFVVILPAVDRAIDFDREIHAGDVIDLGSGLTFTPAEGWGFPDGVLLDGQRSAEEGPRGAKVTSDGVTLRVTTGPFRGSPEELLTQIRKINDAFGAIEGYTVLSDVETVSTSDGVQGVSQAFTAVNVEGFIAAFVIDGVGVEFVVVGPSSELLEHDDAVLHMVTSLRDTEEGVD
jgi:hypothetical protein